MISIPHHYQQGWGREPNNNHTTASTAKPGLQHVVSIEKFRGSVQDVSFLIIVYYVYIYMLYHSSSIPMLYYYYFIYFLSYIYIHQL